MARKHKPAFIGRKLYSIFTKRRKLQREHQMSRTNCCRTPPPRQRRERAQQEKWEGCQWNINYSDSNKIIGLSDRVFPSSDCRMREECQAVWDGAREHIKLSLWIQWKVSSTVCASLRNDMETFSNLFSIFWWATFLSLLLVDNRRHFSDIYDIAIENVDSFPQLVPHALPWHVESSHSCDSSSRENLRLRL